MRFPWPLLVFLIFQPYAVQAHPQSNSVKTPADFDSARTKAEDGRPTLRPSKS
jgi:hypothetical protein